MAAYERTSPKQGWWLAALRNMRKDLLDTIKPYKSVGYYLKRDLAQPLWGAFFTGTALFMLPFVLFVIPIVCLMHFCKPVDFVTKAGGNLPFLLGCILDCTVCALRGITQLLTFPLTYFVKIPLRCILTYCYGTQKIEEGKGIQRLVQECNALLNLEGNEPTGSSQALATEETTYCKIAMMVQIIHEKFSKGYDRGQDSKLIKKDDRLSIVSSEEVRPYEKLFTPNNKSKITKDMVCEQEDEILYDRKHRHPKWRMAGDDRKTAIAKYLNLFRIDTVGSWNQPESAVSQQPVLP